MNRTIGLITTNYSVPGFAELTEARPPAALPFGGRYRLMDFALSNMVHSRITTVGFITPYYYRSIMDHMGSGKPWNLDRKEGGLFVLPGSIYGYREDDTRFMLRDLLHNTRYLKQGDGDYILCTDCSMIYNADHQPMLQEHELSGNPVTLLYKPVDPTAKHKGWYVTLDADGRVTRLTFDDQGENLVLNCFVINRSAVLQILEDYRAMGHMDLLEVLSGNLDKFRVGSYAFKGYVGFTDGLEEFTRTSMDLLQPEIRRELFNADRPIHTKIHDEPPALIQPGSAVRNSLVSAGSIIEGTVENCILFREVRVDKGAVLRNCIVMEHSVIGAGAEMDWAICDKYVSIGEGVHVSGTEAHPFILPKGKII